MLKDACVQTIIFVLPHFPRSSKEIRVRCLRTCQTVLQIDQETAYESFVLQLKFVPYNQIKKDYLRTLPLPKRQVLRFKDDEQKMEKTYENSKVQTIIAVSPHILDEDTVANVFKDSSMQTLISFTPNESLTRVEQSLKTLIAPEDRKSQTNNQKERMDVDSDHNHHEQQIKKVMDNTVKKLEDRLNRMVKQYGSKPGKYPDKSNTIQSTERLGDSRRNKRYEVACECGCNGPQGAAVFVLQQDTQPFQKKETLATRSTPEVNKQCIQYKRSSLPDLLTIRLAGGLQKHKKRLGPCSKFENSFTYPGRKMWQNNQLLVNQEPDYADSYLEQLFQENSVTQTDQIESDSCKPEAIEIPWHLLTYQIKEKAEINHGIENAKISPDRLKELTVANFSPKQLDQIKKEILDDPLGNDNLPLEDIKTLVLKEGGYKPNDSKKEFKPEDVKRPKLKPEQVFDPSCVRDNEPYMDRMYTYFPDNCNEVGVCSSRIEMPWDNILVPKKCIIRKKYNLPKKNEAGVKKYKCNKCTANKAKLDVTKKKCGCGRQLMDDLDMEKKSQRESSRNRKTRHNDKVIRKKCECGRHFTEKEEKVVDINKVDDVISKVADLDKVDGADEEKLEVSSFKCGCEALRNQTKIKKTDLSKSENDVTMLRNSVPSPNISQTELLTTQGVKPSTVVPQETNLLNTYRENCDICKKCPIPPQSIPKDEENKLSTFKNRKLNSKTDRIAEILESCKKEMEPIKDGINQLRDKIRELNLQDLKIYSDESQISKNNNYQSPCYMSSYASVAGNELSFAYSQPMPMSYPYPPCVPCCPFAMSQMRPPVSPTPPDNIFPKASHRSRSRNKKTSKWTSSSASEEDLPFSEESLLSEKIKTPPHDKSIFDKRKLSRDPTDSDSSDVGISRKSPRRFNSKNVRKKKKDTCCQGIDIGTERKVRSTKGTKNKSCYVSIERKPVRSEEETTETENSECENIICTETESNQKPDTYNLNEEPGKKSKGFCCCMGNNGALNQINENKITESYNSVVSSQVDDKIARKSDENKSMSNSSQKSSPTGSKIQGKVQTCTLKQNFYEPLLEEGDNINNTSVQNSSKSVSIGPVDSKTINSSSTTKCDAGITCCLESDCDKPCALTLKEEDRKNDESVSKTTNDSIKRCGVQCINPNYCPKYYQYYPNNDVDKSEEKLVIKAVEKEVKDACTCTETKEMSNIQSQSTQSDSIKSCLKNAETNVTKSITDSSTCTACDAIIGENKNSKKKSAATNITLCDNNCNINSEKSAKTEKVGCTTDSCAHKMNKSNKIMSVPESIDGKKQFEPTEIDNTTCDTTNCVYKIITKINNETVVEEETDLDKKKSKKNKLKHKWCFKCKNPVTKSMQSSNVEVVEENLLVKETDEIIDVNQGDLEVIGNNNQCSKFSCDQQKLICDEKIRQCQLQIEEKYKNIQDYLSKCHDMLKNDTLKIDENISETFKDITTTEQKTSSKNQESIDTKNKNYAPCNNTACTSKNSDIKNDKCDIQKCNQNSSKTPKDVDLEEKKFGCQDKLQQSKRENTKVEDERGNQKGNDRKMDCGKICGNNQIDTKEPKPRSPNRNDRDNKKQCNSKCISFMGTQNTDEADNLDVDEKSVKDSTYTKSEDGCLEDCSAKKSKWISKIPKRCEASCSNKCVEDFDQCYWKTAKEGETPQNCSTKKPETELCTIYNPTGLPKEKPKTDSNKQGVVTTCNESNCCAYDTPLCSKYKCQGEDNESGSTKVENKQSDQPKKYSCPCKKQQSGNAPAKRNESPTRVGAGCRNTCAEQNSSKRSNQCILENGAFRNEENHPSATSTCTTSSSNKEILKHLDQGSIDYSELSSMSSLTVPYCCSAYNSIINASDCAKRSNYSSTRYFINQLNYSYTNSCQNRKTKHELLNVKYTCLDEALRKLTKLCHNSPSKKIRSPEELPSPESTENMIQAKCSCIPSKRSSYTNTNHENSQEPQSKKCLDNYHGDSGLCQNIDPSNETYKDDYKTKKNFDTDKFIFNMGIIPPITTMKQFDVNPNAANINSRNTCSACCSPITVIEPSYGLTENNNIVNQVISSDTYKCTACGEAITRQRNPVLYSKPCIIEEDSVFETNRNNAVNSNFREKCEASCSISNGPNNIPESDENLNEAVSQSDRQTKFTNNNCTQTKSDNSNKTADSKGTENGFPSSKELNTNQTDATKVFNAEMCNRPNNCACLPKIIFEINLRSGNIQADGNICPSSCKHQQSDPVSNSARSESTRTNSKTEYTETASNRIDNNQSSKEPYSIEEPANNASNIANKNTSDASDTSATIEQSRQPVDIQLNNEADLEIDLVTSKTRTKSDQSCKMAVCCIGNKKVKSKCGCPTDENILNGDIIKPTGKTSASNSKKSKSNRSNVVQPPVETTQLDGDTPRNDEDEMKRNSLVKGSYKGSSSNSVRSKSNQSGQRQNGVYKRGQDFGSKTESCLCHSTQKLENSLNKDNLVSDNKTIANKKSSSTSNVSNRSNARKQYDGNVTSKVGKCVCSSQQILENPSDVAKANTSNAPRSSKRNSEQMAANTRAKSNRSSVTSSLAKASENAAKSSSKNSLSNSVRSKSNKSKLNESLEQDGNNFAMDLTVQDEEKLSCKPDICGCPEVQNLKKVSNPSVSTSVKSKSNRSMADSSAKANCRTSFSSNTSITKQNDKAVNLKKKVVGSKATTCCCPLIENLSEQAKLEKDKTDKISLSNSVPSKSNRSTTKEEQSEHVSNKMDSEEFGNKCVCPIQQKDANTSDSANKTSRPTEGTDNSSPIDLSLPPKEIGSKSNQSNITNQSNRSVTTSENKDPSGKNKPCSCSTDQKVASHRISLTPSTQSKSNMSTAKEKDELVSGDRRKEDIVSEVGSCHCPKKKIVENGVDERQLVDANDNAVKMDDNISLTNSGQSESNVSTAKQKDESVSGDRGEEDIVSKVGSCLCPKKEIVGNGADECELVNANNNLEEDNLAIDLSISAGAKVEKCGCSTDLNNDDLMKHSDKTLESSSMNSNRSSTKGKDEPLPSDIGMEDFETESCYCHKEQDVENRSVNENENTANAIDESSLIDGEDSPKTEKDAIVSNTIEETPRKFDKCVCFTAKEDVIPIEENNLAIDLTLLPSKARSMSNHSNDTQKSYKSISNKLKACCCENVTNVGDFINRPNASEPNAETLVTKSGNELDLPTEPPDETISDQSKHISSKKIDELDSSNKEDSGKETCFCPVEQNADTVNDNITNDKLIEEGNKPASQKIEELGGELDACICPSENIPNEGDCIKPIDETLLDGARKKSNQSDIVSENSKPVVTDLESNVKEASMEEVAGSNLVEEDNKISLASSVENKSNPKIQDEAFAGDVGKEDINAKPECYCPGQNEEMSLVEGDETKTEKEEIISNKIDNEEQQEEKSSDSVEINEKASSNASEINEPNISISSAENKKVSSKIESNNPESCVCPINPTDNASTVATEAEEAKVSNKPDVAASPASDIKSDSCFCPMEQNVENPLGDTAEDKEDNTAEDKGDNIAEDTNAKTKCDEIVSNKSDKADKLKICVCFTPQNVENTSNLANTSDKVVAPQMDDEELSKLKTCCCDEEKVSNVEITSDLANTNDKSVPPQMEDKELSNLKTCCCHEENVANVENSSELANTNDDKDKMEDKELSKLETCCCNEENVANVKNSSNLANTNDEIVPPQMKDKELSNLKTCCCHEENVANLENSSDLGNIIDESVPPQMEDKELSNLKTCCCNEENVANLENSSELGNIIDESVPPQMEDKELSNLKTCCCNEENVANLENSSELGNIIDESVPPQMEDKELSNLKTCCCNEENVANVEISSELANTNDEIVPPQMTDKELSNLQTCCCKEENVANLENPSDLGNIIDESVPPQMEDTELSNLKTCCCNEENVANVEISSELANTNDEIVPPQMEDKELGNLKTCCCNEDLSNTNDKIVASPIVEDVETNLETVPPQIENKDLSKLKACCCNEDNVSSEDLANPIAHKTSSIPINLGSRGSSFVQAYHKTSSSSNIANQIGEADADETCKCPKYPDIVKRLKKGDSIHTSNIPLRNSVSTKANTTQTSKDVIVITSKMRSEVVACVCATETDKISLQSKSNRSQQNTEAIKDPPDVRTSKELPPDELQKKFKSCCCRSEENNVNVDKDSLKDKQTLSKKSSCNKAKCPETKCKAKAAGSNKAVEHLDSDSNSPADIKTDLQDAINSSPNVMVDTDPPKIADSPLATSIRACKCIVPDVPVISKQPSSKKSSLPKFSNATGSLSAKNVIINCRLENCATKKGNSDIMVEKDPEPSSHNPSVKSSNISSLPILMKNVSNQSKVEPEGSLSKNIAHDSNKSENNPSKGKCDKSSCSKKPMPDNKTRKSNASSNSKIPRPPTKEPDDLQSNKKISLIARIGMKMKNYPKSCTQEDCKVVLGNIQPTVNTLSQVEENDITTQKYDKPGIKMKGGPKSCTQENCKVDLLSHLKKSDLESIIPKSNKFAITVKDNPKSCTPENCKVAVGYIEPTKDLSQVKKINDSQNQIEPISSTTNKCIEVKDDPSSCKQPNCKVIAGGLKPTEDTISQVKENEDKVEVIISTCNKREEPGIKVKDNSKSCTKQNCKIAVSNTLQVDPSLIKKNKDTQKKIEPIISTSNKRAKDGPNSCTQQNCKVVTGSTQPIVDPISQAKKSDDKVESIILSNIRDESDTKVKYCTRQNCKVIASNIHPTIDQLSKVKKNVPTKNKCEPTCTALKKSENDKTEAPKQYTTQIKADFLGNSSTKQSGGKEMYMEIVSQNSSDAIGLIEDVYDKAYSDKTSKP